MSVKQEQYWIAKRKYTFNLKLRTISLKPEKAGIIVKLFVWMSLNSIATNQSIIEQRENFPLISPVKSTNISRSTWVLLHSSTILLLPWYYSLWIPGSSSAAQCLLSHPKQDWRMLLSPLRIAMHVTTPKSKLIRQPTAVSSGEDLIKFNLQLDPKPVQTVLFSQTSTETDVPHINGIT